MKTCCSPSCSRPVFSHGYCRVHVGEYYSAKKKVKKVKKKTRPQLVKELDRVFSIFIRSRNVNKEGITKCFTCGKTAHWKELQCGHFISRRHYSTRWDEKNCQTQCAGCNIFNQGNAPVFAQRLIAKFGTDILDLLIAKRDNILKASNSELEILINEYTNKSKNFTSEK